MGLTISPNNTVFTTVQDSNQTADNANAIAVLDLENDAIEQIAIQNQTQLNDLPDLVSLFNIGIEAQ